MVGEFIPKMMYHPLLLASALSAVLAAPVQAESEHQEHQKYIVCFGQEAGNDMHELVEVGDMEAASLYARLHCWMIQPPARDPLRGTDKWTPFPNIPAMPGDKWLFVRWWGLND